MMKNYENALKFCFHLHSQIRHTVQFDDIVKSTRDELVMKCHSTGTYRNKSDRCSHVTRTHKTGTHDLLF